jgi:hypothetical protein
MIRIKVVESALVVSLKQKYIQIYCDTRNENNPIEYSFLITKTKFQDYIITKMLEYPGMSYTLVEAYEKIKQDKTLQERAITVYQEEAKHVPLN